MALKVLNTEGKEVGSVDVPSVLQVDNVNQHLIWEVVTAEHANMRQGTHKTRTIGEVRGGGKKPWRQKGTGRARSGSIRAPHWKGGATTFGPQPKSYRVNLSRKKKKAGIRNILAQKISKDSVVLVDSLNFDSVNTKQAFGALSKVVEGSPFAEAYKAGRKIRANSNDNRRKVTLISDSDEQSQKKSIRNIPWVRMIHVDRLAAVPVFENHGILITKAAFEKLSERLQG